MNAYPTDFAGLQQLADDLVAAGYKPTQDISKMRKVDIEQMAADMENGVFDWSRFKPWQKVVVGPGGEVMDGHHRVVASMVSGVPIPPDQIYQFPGANLRPVFDWIDVLPR